jgi:EmrB/QacA subfamily drug resistance transporter
MSQIGKPPCDDALIRSGGPSSPSTVWSQRWVLAAAILGSSMAFIDATVVNVALPAIQAELHATASEAQWVIESYALLLAALLLVGGSLGDRFGRRRIFAIGVAVFALASVVCSLSADLHQLIAARAVQGIGAALLVPGSLALISASFPEEARGHAIGAWSGFSGIASAFGPVLGGFLIEHYSWAWAFLVNLPLAVIVLSILRWGVPESRGASAAARLDAWGAVLAAVALGGIVYAFVEAPTRHWGSLAVRSALLVGVAASAGFVAVELRAASPMLPLRLFRHGNFLGANLLTLLLYAALGGGLFYFPLVLIQVQGYTATAAGAALLPFILIMFAMSRWAGGLVDRFGPMRPLIAGPVIAASGFALLGLPGVEAGAAGYWSSYLPAIAVLGIGMTVTVAPLATTVMDSVGPDLAGVASGVNNAVARTAGLLAIAVFGTVVAWAFDASLDGGLREAGAPDGVSAILEAQRSKLAGIELPSGLDPRVASALGRIVKLSYVSGFRWVMLFSAGLALLSALVAWLLIQGRPFSAQPEDDPKQPHMPPQIGDGR